MGSAITNKMLGFRLRIAVKDYTAMTQTIFEASVLTGLVVGLAAVTAALVQTVSVSSDQGLQIAPQNFADLRADASDPGTVFPSRRSQPYRYNDKETDGLSLNPNACVVWACVDNN